MSMEHKFLLGLSAGVIALSVTLTGCATSPNYQTTGTKIPFVAGENISDALGSYSLISVNPENSLLSYPPSTETIVDVESLTANGFTEADAEAASKSALSFVTTEMIDNASIDTPDTYAATLQTLAEKYMTGAYIPIMTDPQKSTIVFHVDPGITFVRDGKPRISASGALPLEISASTLNDGRKTILISGMTDTYYRLDEASKKPQGKNALRAVSSWSLYMEPDANGVWKIAGYQTNFENSLVP